MQIVEMTAWLTATWDEDAKAYGGHEEECESYYSQPCDCLHGELLVRTAAERALLTEYRETIEHYNNGARNAPAGEVTGLETALKIIASGYASRPGYNEQWRP